MCKKFDSFSHEVVPCSLGASTGIETMWSQMVPELGWFDVLRQQEQSSFVYKTL